MGSAPPDIYTYLHTLSLSDALPILFVYGGRWADDSYVPVGVRRYPFGFIATDNPEGFALAIDTSSERLVQAGDECAALFEDGMPTELTRSEERRVGKGWVRTCRYEWSP